MFDGPSKFFWFSHAPHPMRKRHENHVRKRVLLNGGDRTVVEQETPEKALAGLDARKPIGYRAVAVSFTLFNATDNANFRDIWLQLGSKVLSCVSSASPPSRSEFLDPCRSPDDYQRDLAMIIGVEKKKETVARKCVFAHYRDSVAIISLFFGTFECWQSSLQLV